MAFFAYMLLCADGSYYTGHTDNLDHRIADHQHGRFSGYTKNRRPVRLVWSQDFVTREEALAAEHQIKGWTRAKKEALIDQRWMNLPDFLGEGANSWFDKLTTNGRELRLRRMKQ
jgi:predicted GIY-YIG superfamily endonuclease